MSTPKPEDEREALANVRYTVHGGTTMPDGVFRVGYPAADAILAAGFSRVVPVSDEAATEHRAWFGRFRCEECGQPITTQRTGPASERWVHMSDLDKPVEAAYREERP